jgi:ribosomal protein L6P/L9E
MSRIGKLPINLPSGVKVTVDEKNTVTVEGKLGTLTQEVSPAISINVPFFPEHTVLPFPDRIDTDIL